jgi:hypothetical protein
MFSFFLSLFLFLFFSFPSPSVLLPTVLSFAYFFLLFCFIALFLSSRMSLSDFISHLYCSLPLLPLLMFLSLRYSPGLRFYRDVR